MYNNKMKKIQNDKKFLLTITLSLALITSLIIGAIGVGIFMLQSSKNETARAFYVPSTNWIDNRAAAWQDGEGSVLAPFIISSPELMALMAHDVSANTIYDFGNGSFASREAHFLITNDIDLAAHNWVVPNGVFSGSLRATNNATIYNFTHYSDNNSSVGIFSSLGADAIIENIVFNNAMLESSRSAVNMGIIAGEVASGTVLINNITICEDSFLIRNVEAQISSVGTVIGLVHADANLDIKNIIVKASISINEIAAAGSGTGGVIGMVTGVDESLSIDNVVFEGSISTLSGRTGGLVGALLISNSNLNSVAINNSKFLGSIVSNGNQTGGFMGAWDGISDSASLLISGSIIDGTILTAGAAAHTGGMIGVISGNGLNRKLSLRDIDIMGNITAQNNVGGMIGGVLGGNGFVLETDTISNTRNYAVVMSAIVTRVGTSATNHSGGLIGTITRNNSDVSFIDVNITGSVITNGGHTGAAIGNFVSNNSSLVIENVNVSNGTTISMHNLNAPNAEGANRFVSGLVSFVDGNNVSVFVSEVEMNATLTGGMGIQVGATFGAGLFGAVHAQNSTIKIQDTSVGGALYVRHAVAGGVVGRFGSTNTVLVAGADNFNGSTISITDTVVNITINVMSQAVNLHQLPRSIGGVIGLVQSAADADNAALNNILIEKITVNSTVNIRDLITAPIARGRIVGQVVGDYSHIIIDSVTTSGMTANSTDAANQVVSSLLWLGGIGGYGGGAEQTATIPEGLQTSFVGIRPVNADNIIEIRQSAAVVFDTRGGTNMPPLTAYSVNPQSSFTFIIPTTIPVVGTSNHEFRGWARNSTATIAEVEFLPNETGTVTVMQGDILTYFAITSQIMHTLVLRVGDTIFSTQTVGQGDTFSTWAYPSNITGHTFSHWANLDGTITFTFGGSFVMPASNLNLYAVWNYNVYFDNFAQYNQTNIVGNTQILLPNLNATATHDFRGWRATGTTGTPLTDNFTVTGHVVFEAVWVEVYTVTFIQGDATTITRTAHFVDNYIIQNFPSVSNPIGSINSRWRITTGGDGYLMATTNITSNMIVVAVWDWTVSFNFANGNVSTNTQFVENGLTATVPAGPSRVGHDFRYWAIDGVEFNFSTLITQNITLTAIWDEYFTVIFIQADGTTIARTAHFADNYIIQDLPSVNNPIGSINERWRIVGANDYLTLTISQNFTVEAMWDWIITFGSFNGYMVADMVVAKNEYVLLPNVDNITTLDFIGWRANGNGDVIASNNAIRIIQSTNFVAIWVANVSFYDNENLNLKNVERGSQIALTTLENTDSYRFLGWRIVGEEEIINGNFLIEGHTTLEAVWEEINNIFPWWWILIGIFLLFIILAAILIPILIKHNKKKRQRN